MPKKFHWFAFLLVLLSAFSVQAISAQREIILPILVVNTGALNVRSGPGPQYSILTTVRGGAELPVLGTNGDGSWYLITSPIGAGWVDVDFTLPRGDFRFVPAISVEAILSAAATPQTLQLLNEAPIPQPVLGGAQVVVNTGNLNVRTGPGSQFSIVTRVPGGTVLIPVGVTTDNVWYLVEGDFGRGWIASQFTLFRGSFNGIPVLTYQ